MSDFISRIYMYTIYQIFIKAKEESVDKVYGEDSKEGNTVKSNN